MLNYLLTTAGNGVSSNGTNLASASSQWPVRSRCNKDNYAKSSVLSRI